MCCIMTVSDALWMVFTEILVKTEPVDPVWESDDALANSEICPETGLLDTCPSDDAAAGAGGGVTTDDEDAVGGGAVTPDEEDAIGGDGVTPDDEDEEDGVDRYLLKIKEEKDEEWIPDDKEDDSPPAKKKRGKRNLYNTLLQLLLFNRTLETQNK